MKATACEAASVKQKPLTARLTASWPSASAAQPPCALLLRSYYTRASIQQRSGCLPLQTTPLPRFRTLLLIFAARHACREIKASTTGRTPGPFLTVFNFLINFRLSSSPTTRIPTCSLALCDEFRRSSVRLILHSSLRLSPTSVRTRRPNARSTIYASASLSSLPMPNSRPKRRIFV